MTIAERSASKRNRQRQQRAERRLDEQVAVHQIRVEYERADRVSDLEMEQAFSRLYQVADDDEEREAVARAFVVYQKGERVEELAVSMSVDQATTILKRNNPFFIDGAWTPTDSDGAA